MRLAKQNSFERWDLAEPLRPQTSALYALVPYGLGTPYVESLSSYISRLAEAHVVSVSRLLRQMLSPVRPGPIPFSTMHYAYPANVLAKDSETLLEKLQAVTGRNDLWLLTLSALHGAVSQPNLFRTTEAWCPSCLEQWRMAEAPVYSPLLWTIRAVTVCPAHSTLLTDRCPHCHFQFASLRANSRPGYCSVCSQWLGTLGMQLPNGCADEREYQLWASTSVGQVLAIMPELQRIQASLALRMNLQRCLNQMEGASKEALATLANAGPCAFLGWVSGRVKPTLDHLCRLSYQLEIPLAMLFTGVPAEWRGPERLRRQNDFRKDKSYAQRPVIVSTELRRSLAGALSENPPPSVAEIARRLEFRRTATLWVREPDLCRQIAARRRTSGTMSNATQLYKCEKQRLESVLRRYLTRQNSPSVNEIAFQLGYKGSGSIRERFPELCRAISAKRSQQTLRKRETLRLAVETARTESPPPSLKQLARRLGLGCVNVLTGSCPETCASYKQWRRAWADEQRDKLRLSICGWLAAEPAPSVASLCRHFGISASYLQLRFPPENRKVVQRTAERTRAARENRVVIMRQEIFKIVHDLYEKNLYPSIPRVKSALSEGLPRAWPLLRILIDEAISQFGSVMRQRDELGRFA
jgi:AraC-like DNA-binding protein/transcriptional regulator with XRE-family HTH domain